MNRTILLVGGITLLMGLLFWAIWPAQQPSTGAGEVHRIGPESRDVVLYFIASDGFSLVSEEQSIAGCNDERQCIAQTLEALSAGSQLFQPVLPEQTRVLGVELEKDLVRVDFSRDLVNRHPGGSLSELLTVYGITNTLAVNFPALRRVQFLVEGKLEQTLKGHVDISRPIKADFRYSLAAEIQDEQLPLQEEGAAHPVSGAQEE